MGNHVSNLIMIKELLSDPEKWTKTAQARDKNGKSVSYYSEKAVRWCLLGVVNRQCYGSSSKLFNETYRALRKAVGTSVSMFNDDESTTHKDILDVLEKSIQAG